MRLSKRILSIKFGRGNLFTLPSVRKVSEANVRKVSEANAEKAIYRSFL